MATPLEKALCSQGSRCRKVWLWYKAVSGFGKPKLRSGGPSSQKNVTPDVRLRKTLSMNLPRIQLEIYELWKTCRVPASCDFQPRILLSANKTWRQHNAWLAANELNYGAGVWRGRKRRNDWGARQRDGRARTKGRNPGLPFFRLTRSLIKKKMLQTFCPEPWIPFSVAQRLLGLLEVCTEKYKVIFRN